MQLLLSQPKATAINISGGVAFVPMTLTPTYSATKAAIHSWSQSLRFELRDTNVRVLESCLPTCSPRSSALAAWPIPWR